MPPKKPKEKSPKTSSPSSLARPDIKKLRAKEEHRDDKRDKSPDSGPPDPSLRRNREGECPHGRVFSCVRCKRLEDDQKIKVDDQERKESLVKAIRQFHRSTFNIVALVTGNEGVRLNDQEETALGDSGTACMLSAAPEVSIPTINIAGYIVTLGGVITEKILDGQPSTPDSGGQADGKDDAGPEVPKMSFTPPNRSAG